MSKFALLVVIYQSSRITQIISIILIIPWSVHLVLGDWKMREPLTKSLTLYACVQAVEKESKRYLGIYLFNNKNIDSFHHIK